MKHAIVKSWSTLAAACASLGLAACAVQPAYNPYGLDNRPLTRVGELCQNALRLSPSQAVTPGYWPGNPDPGYWTSPYRNCVASLSQSLRLASAAQQHDRADAQCVAQGLASGSPALAACVLQTSKTLFDAQPASEVGAQLTEHPDAVPAGLDMTHREEWVCAQLGLVPPGGVFASCVRGLDRTLMAQDMNESYTN